MLARLPTVLQLDPEQIYISTTDGAYLIMSEPSYDVQLTLRQYLPADTWCLVDTNARLTQPSSTVLMLHRFIVQTALPDVQSMKWTKQVRGVVPHYFMQPWSLQELISG